MIADFKKRRNKSPLLKLVLLVGILGMVFVGGFLVVADVKVYLKKKQLRDQVEALQKKVADLAEKNKDLKEGISSADDVSYIEKIAREELNLQKPGEQVVSFVMPEEKAEVKLAPQKGFFSSWFGWLSGLFKE